MCEYVCVKIHAQFAFHLFHLEMFSLAVTTHTKYTHSHISLPSLFSLPAFIFRSLSLSLARYFFVFKSAARCARRCTLLFALLLINSFRKQIFTCMRSIEAIYIILVYECVYVCVEWKRILHQFIMCRVFSSVYIHHTHTLYTSMGSLNVTINSDEFVDMLSASMRHIYVNSFFFFFCFSFVIRVHLLLIVSCRMCCIKQYLCVCACVRV